MTFAERLQTRRSHSAEPDKLALPAWRKKVLAKRLAKRAVTGLLGMKQRPAGRLHLENGCIGGTDLLRQWDIGFSS